MTSALVSALCSVSGSSPASPYENGESQPKKASIRMNTIITRNMGITTAPTPPPTMSEAPFLANMRLKICDLPEAAE